MMWNKPRGYEGHNRIKFHVSAWYVGLTYCPNMIAHPRRYDTHVTASKWLITYVKSYI